MKYILVLEIIHKAFIVVKKIIIWRLNMKFSSTEVWNNFSQFFINKMDKSDNLIKKQQLSYE